MKKLITATLAITLAGIVSAGTVTWSANGISKGSTALEGTIAYLFVGDSITGVADAIKNGTFDYSEAIANTKTESGGYFRVSGIGDYKSTTVSLYTVFFDTATVSATSKFAIGGPISQTFGATGNKNYNFSNSIDANNSWQAVPEPTTVALLALGLAAVGLKRKIA